MFGAVRRGQFLAARSLRASIARPIALSSAIRSPLRITQRGPSVAATEVLSKRAFSTSFRWTNAQAGLKTDEGSNDAELAEKTLGDVAKFQELADKGLVTDRVVSVLTKEMGLETLTDVQRLTINACLDGRDVLAQAKTGTGKTLGFLIPVIQNMLKDPTLENKRGMWSADHSDIRAIVISPTRELAEQIAVEANKVVKKTGIVVQTAVGGNRKREALFKMQREGCHILVGTPGRMIDLFSDPRSGVSAPKLQCLVLDEADRLLDIGFAPDIAELQRYFPDRKEFDRQTLMFSATVPNAVMKMVRQSMKPDFKFVKCVDENEEPTHLSVPQKMVFLNGFENEMPALIQLFQRAVAEHKADPENIRPFKAIIYFNSTAEVKLAMEAYRNIAENAFRNRDSEIPCLDFTEMHSRLTQQARTRNSDFFRRSKSCLLFSSDVTARGMDFPNVTHVIQVGLPRDRETYIHRLGRTARANKKGEGWILVHDAEMSDLRSKLAKLPLKEDTTALPAAEADLTMPEKLTPEVGSLVQRVQDGFKLVDFREKRDAFRAFFGSYGSMNKRRLVEMVNNVTQHGWGLSEPLKVSPMLAQRLGLSRIPGVNIGDDGFRDDSSRSSPRPGFGSFSGRGGSGGSRFGGDRMGGGAPRGRFGDRMGGGAPRGRFGDRMGGDSAPRGRFGDRMGGDRPPRGRFGDRMGGDSAPRGRFGDRSGGRGSFDKKPRDKSGPRQPHWMGRGSRR
ncbi:hypothetical protein KEM55_003853 [Ascosphaera atra]|nr:hypothetical protein KEM55_003853 [Ascosphaera atra]